MQRANANATLASPRVRIQLGLIYNQRLEVNALKAPPSRSTVSPSLPVDCLRSWGRPTWTFCLLLWYDFIFSFNSSFGSTSSSSSIRFMNKVFFCSLHSFIFCLFCLHRRLICLFYKSSMPYPVARPTLTPSVFVCAGLGTCSTWSLRLHLNLPRRVGGAIKTTTTRK